MKRAVAAVAISLMCCREPTRTAVTTVPAAKTLKVSLPVDFTADPIAAGLEIRHRNLVVGTLELKPGPKPSTDSVKELLEKSGALSMVKESEELYFGFSYTLSGDAGNRLAFLGLNSRSGPSVGCASTAAIPAEDVEAFAGICKSVSLVVTGQ